MGRFSINRILTALVLLCTLIWVDACVKLTDGGKPDRMWQNVAYDDQSDRQKMDVFLPVGDGPFPLIINIHGGGFIGGHKAGPGTEIVIGSAMQRGFAVASINYRLSGEAPFPAAVTDTMTAIKFLKANADTFKIDPERIAVWGASAGGNLAAMAGTRGNAQDGTDVQAVVTMFAPLRFDVMDEQLEALDLQRTKINQPNSIYSAYLGATVGSRDAAGLVFAADPMSYITPDDPPVLIQHGTADNHVPPQQSEMLAEALRPVIGDENVELYIYEGAKHGGAPFDDDDTLDKVYTFIDRHLGISRTAQLAQAAD